jgi:hypothetical protein
MINMTSVHVILFLIKFPGRVVISFDDILCCDVIQFTGYNVKDKMRAGVVERSEVSSIMS